MELPQGKERGVIVRTKAREVAAKEQIETKGTKAQEPWEKQLWHVPHQKCACEPDAPTA
jgi:hypothetical protein